jgi:hypothetical protein
MSKVKFLICALATVMAAAGVFGFSAYAGGFAVAEPAEPTPAPAPTGPTTPMHYTAPRYFNPTPPREDNPTSPPGTWEVYPSPTTRHLYCVDFIDESNGWGGGGSVALRYVNGTWSEIPGHSGHVFEDMDVLSANDGWAVGWDGNKELPAIWRWNGSDWKEFQNPTGAVYCIDMIDNSHGWIGGKNYFLRFNGTSWEWGGSAPDPMDDIKMNNDSDGRAVGYRYIMRRIGNNWVEEATNINWNLGRLYMVNSGLGWVTGIWQPSERALILRYEGSWKVDIIFSDYYNIFNIVGFTDGTAWTCANKNLNPPPDGVFLYFNGNRWEVINNPDQGKNVMISLYFFNRGNGWGVGSYGKIWRYRPNVALGNTSLGKIKAIYR